MATKAPTKQPASNKTAVTKAEGFAIVQSKEIPDYMAQSQGRGNENVGTKDLVIPRLELIQALSPAVVKGDPMFIKGAEPGMYTNSVTRELYGEEVTVIPVHFQVQYLVWRDRKLAKELKIQAGGGFFGAFNSMDEANAKAQEEGGRAQAIIVEETPTHLCLLMNSSTGTLDEIMLSMPRTKQKVSRQWNSMIKLNGGDRFSRAYTFKSVSQQNSDGDNFLNMSVETLGFPSKSIYQKAEALYKSVAGGLRRTMDVSGMGEDEGGGAPSEM